jgi:hypothetical protein
LPLPFDIYEEYFLELKERKFIGPLIGVIKSNEEIYKEMEDERNIKNEININFKIWLESNIQKIDPDILRNLYSLLEKLHKLNGIKPINLGYLDVNGNEVKVIVVEDRRGAFDPVDNTLYIRYVEKNGVMDLENMKREARHEVGHAIDKKQSSEEWKGISQEYRDIFKNNPGYMTAAQKDIYFTELVEFDAICSEAEAEIRHVIKNKTMSKERAIEILGNWLKNDDNQLFFIKKEILNIWKEHPLLYRKLKLRIYKLHKELSI